MTDIATTEPYELLDDESSTDSLEMPAGASLLVTAPNSVGREFIAGRLGEGLRAGDRRLVVTADDAGTVVDRAAAAAGVGTSAVADNLRVIDCRTDRVGPGTRDSAAARNVGTPRNLTDIGIGFFLLAATAHDEETVGTLRRALDGAVEVRDEDGLSARVVGFDGVPSDWHASDR